MILLRTAKEKHMPLFYEGETQTAYGYCRVSTKKQETEGYSLEAQREQIELCQGNNFDLKGFYSEAMSGAKRTDQNSRSVRAL